MFICQSCHKQQPAHVSPATVVLQARQVIYPERRKKNGYGEDVIDFMTGEPIVLDRGGEGWEVVREIKVCGPCDGKYAKLKETVGALQ